MGLKEIAVFGNGPAGLSSTRELANKGYSVHLYHPDLQRVDRSVYTTDALTTKDQNVEFFPEEHIYPLPNIRILTTGGTDVRVRAGTGRYFMIDYPTILEQLEISLEQQTNVQVHTFSAPLFRESAQFTDTPDGVEVRIDQDVRTFDAVIDATGIESRVIDKAKKGEDAENFLVEYVYGGIYLGEFEHPDLLLVFGPGGGTSWANPSIRENHVDIAYSAWGPKNLHREFLLSAKPRLNELVNFLKQNKGINIRNSKPEHIFSGCIRSQPQRKPRFNHIYAIGEAAGMAKPTSGDSFQRAIVAGEVLTHSIDHQNPAQFHRHWKSQKYNKSDDFFLAAALARLPFQSRGQTGGVIDQLQQFVNQGRDDVIPEVENYIIEGKLSPKLLAYILTNTSIREYFKKSLEVMSELILKGVTLPQELPLPSVD
ncbi:hypothetical protein JXA63_00130 [Candidatus Woesebacteria bacterium]|nr:hypothetical protein [Candidatus Woesebacteria bacterium]